MGEEDSSFRWNNYLSRYHWRHIDVMDVLSGFQGRARASLEDVAMLLGLPGKLGMSGDKVWDAYLDGQIEGIRNYCETDVVNTYLVYLRFERMRGHLDAAAWAAEVETVREALGRIDAPHWKQFLAAWPQG